MAPAGEKYAHKVELTCPHCGVTRKNGESLVRHCWDKHRSVPLVVTGSSLPEALRAATLLRKQGFAVSFPTPEQIAQALMHGVTL